jgi:hypothetical protein
MGDCCPGNPDKDDPGECGCDTPETDTDGDGTPDCVDMCPDEMSKTDPGECGCDVPASDDAACAAVKDGLAHRYSFGGTGTAVTDSVGSKDGTIMNGGT